MAQQTINVGAAPNDGTGTPLRTAFQYTNSNFSELYTATGPSGNNITVPGTATISGDLTVDTSTLKVDSANNRVGIGTATPSSDLHIRRSGGGSTLEMLRLDNAGAGVNSAVQMTFWAAGTNYGNITGGFGGATPILEYNVGTTGYHEWQISGSQQMRLDATGLGLGETAVNGIKLLSAVTTAGMPATSGTTQSAGSLRLTATNTTGCLDIGTSGAVSWLQACRRTNLADNFDIALNPNGGNVGIGVASPSYKLDVAGAGNFQQLRVSNAAATNIGLVNTTSGLTYSLYSANTASNGFNGFGILDGSSYVLRINTNGALVLSGGTVSASGVGITFPVTQVASSDAKTLDDYEEGTWTPTVAASSGTPTTVTIGTCKYTKIGRQVICTFDFTVVDKGTASGSFIFTIPFASDNFVNCGSFRENGLTGNMGQVFRNSTGDVAAFLYNNATVWVDGYKVLGTYSYCI